MHQQPNELSNASRTFQAGPCLLVTLRGTAALCDPSLLRVGPGPAWVADCISQGGWRLILSTPGRHGRAGKAL
jgi:hypothetical protein